jgi:hypothetical protein
MCGLIAVHVSGTIAGADRGGLVGVAGTVEVGVLPTIAGQKIGRAVGVVVDLIGEAFSHLACGIESGSLACADIVADRGLIETLGTVVDGSTATAGHVGVVRVDEAVAVVVEGIAEGLHGLERGVKGQIVFVPALLPYAVDAAGSGFGGPGADSVLPLAHLVGDDCLVCTVHEAGAVVVKAVADLVDESADGGVQVFTVGHIRVAVAVGVVIAEIEPAVIVEVSGILAAQFFHDDGHEKEQVYVGDIAVAVEVRVSLLDQSEAIVGIGVWVIASDCARLSHSHGEFQTIGDADFVGGESGAAVVVVAVLNLAVGIYRTLICGDHAGQHDLGEEQHLALDILNINGTVVVEVSCWCGVGRDRECRKGPQHQGKSQRRGCYPRNRTGTVVITHGSLHF